MINVYFKALIPKSVKEYINSQSKVEDKLLDAKNRLFRKLSAANSNSYFYSNGKVIDIEIDNSSWIGNCVIQFDVPTQEEAKSKFSEYFLDMSKRGQKFKIEKFEEI